MAIIYGISGIALNHGVARYWNPGIISRFELFQYDEILQKSDVDREVVEKVLDITDERNKRLRGSSDCNWDPHPPPVSLYLSVVLINV
jgi:hypothetical protein